MISQAADMQRKAQLKSAQTVNEASAQRNSVSRQSERQARNRDGGRY
jgi:hypothetical protein